MSLLKKLKALTAPSAIDTLSSTTPDRIREKIERLQLELDGRTHVLRWTFRLPGFEHNDFYLHSRLSSDERDVRSGPLHTYYGSVVQHTAILVDVACVRREKRAQRE